MPCQVYNGSHIQCIGKDTYAWRFSESFLTISVLLHTVWCLGLLTMYYLAVRGCRSVISQQQKSYGMRLDAIRGSCGFAYAVEEKLGREQA